jgi:hypothetical protein
LALSRCVVCSTRDISSSQECVLTQRTILCLYAYMYHPSSAANVCQTADAILPPASLSYSYTAATPYYYSRCAATKYVRRHSNYSIQVTIGSIDRVTPTTHIGLRWLYCGYSSPLTTWATLTGTGNTITVDASTYFTTEVNVYTACESSDPWYAMVESTHTHRERERERERE